MINAGYRELQFMGGSSLTFGRFCRQETYRSIFVDKNVGLAAFIKQICSTAVRLISRTGRPVPETLAVLASGYLEEHQPQSANRSQASRNGASAATGVVALLM